MYSVLPTLIIKYSSRQVLPAGGQVVSHLTLAVFTELGVVFMAGGGAVHKALPLTRLGHSWRKRRRKTLVPDWLSQRNTVKLQSACREEILP